MTIEQIKTLIVLKEILEIKQKILGSYAKGELEEKRPLFHKRLTKDVKTLSLSIALLDGDFLSHSDIKKQINDMIERNLEIEKNGEEIEGLGDISRQKRKEILDRDNDALKECLEALDKFITE